MSRDKKSNSLTSTKNGQTVAQASCEKQTTKSLLKWVKSAGITCKAIAAATSSEAKPSSVINARGQMR